MKYTIMGLKVMLQFHLSRRNIQLMWMGWEPSGYYSGEISIDPSKSNGPVSKLMSSQRIFQLGWMPITALEIGLHVTYADYLKLHS